VAILSDRPGSGATRLAERLRQLRETAPIQLTQGDLGQALADDARGPVGPAAVSSWESPASGRVLPASRVDSYARLFSTPRSFVDGVHLLKEAELTSEEQQAYAELREELLALRRTAMRDTESAEGPRSLWHFPDGTRITLVCSQLPEQLRPPDADPASLNYVRWAELADLDALIEIYGAIRAYNPRSRVVIKAAQELEQRDVANHLVLIGGLAWETVNPWFKRIFPIPIEAGDPAESGAIVVNDPDSGRHEFRYQLDEGALVEDVGYFARGENPSAPRRTLTICGGITTRGVRGAARTFIDYEMKARNEEYLFPRFLSGSTYCIVMRVPVINLDPITPDLSKPENRLFEWHHSGAQAG